MTSKRSTKTSALLLVLTAGLFAAVSVLFAGVASAQNENCPAGGRGGNGGRAGTSTGGTGGLALNVPVFSSGTGGATAGGGGGGSARGGTGGRGGQGVLPVCNQNTNGAVAAAPAAVAAAPAAVAAAPAAAPRTVAAAPARTYGAGGPVAGGRSYGVGGPLARTGSHTSTELAAAGLAFVLGGALLFFGQPLRRVRARA